MEPKLLIFLIGFVCPNPFCDIFFFYRASLSESTLMHQDLFLVPTLNLVSLWNVMWESQGSIIVEQLGKLCSSIYLAVLKNSEQGLYLFKGFFRALFSRKAGLL